MKKSKILKLLSLAAFAMAGAFALAKGKGEEKTEKVEAAGSELTLYVNEFDAGSEKGGKWSNFKYYLYGTGGNNGWPGVAFTDAMKTATPNEYDQYQYKLTIDTAKYQSMVLTGNSDSSWGGAFAKTEDITLASLESNGLYCGEHKGWQTDANVFAVGTYTYTSKTVYLLDLKGDGYSAHYCHTFATGKSGTTWPGVEMGKVAGSKNLYSAEINAALDNVIFNNNDRKETETITSVAANDAFVVYPGEDTGYNKLTLQAAQFVDTYMKFETTWYDQKGTGVCKTDGWYSSAKTAFTAKTAAQKTEILAHEPTKYRLEAWAKANGDAFDTETGAISSGVFSSSLTETRDSSNLIIIVSIVALISASSLVGLIVIKKRRSIAK